MLFSQNLTPKQGFVQKSPTFHDLTGGLKYI